MSLHTQEEAQKESQSQSIKSKHAVLSKTVVINFLTGVICFLPLFDIGFTLTPEQISYLATGVCSINIWLRKVSTHEIHFIKKKV